VTVRPPSSTVPSPCVNVCRMDPATDLCLGCARSLDEIAAWSTLDDLAKRRVWKALPARRALLQDKQPTGNP
jgi:predicted Fe-S protein YdhL (DUF1289 family)